MIAAGAPIVRPSKVALAYVAQAERSRCAPGSISPSDSWVIALGRAIFPIVEQAADIEIKGEMLADIAARVQIDTAIVLHPLVDGAVAQRSDELAAVVIGDFGFQTVFLVGQRRIVENVRRVDEPDGMLLAVVDARLRPALLQRQVARKPKPSNGAGRPWKLRMTFNSTP